MTDARIFVAADLHVGHKKIVTFSRTEYSTVEAHDADVIHRWNACVHPRDTVWILGDVAFGRDALAKLAQLHGRKRLIAGNHDQYPLHAYAELFAGIHGCLEKGGVVFTASRGKPRRSGRGWIARSRIARLASAADGEILNS